jgi:hypothetical protein
MTCAEVRRAIEERRFVGWRGLPAGCTPEALFDVPWDDVWGERQLGAAFEPARTRLLETYGYYRPMAFVRDGRVVMFSGMNPQLAVPWPQLSDDLGEPDAMLDWTHATDPIPGGEWVYSRRGITIFLDPEDEVVIHVSLYAATTADEYARRLRQGHGKRPLPKL